jgi:hypothetical protein
VDELKDARYPVRLAPLVAIPKYEGNKHSGNFADAPYLAQQPGL